MSKQIDHTIESFLIERLEEIGYKYVQFLDIVPNSETAERENYEQVLLLERLRNSVRRINSEIPIEAQSDAIRIVQSIVSSDLLTENEIFHRYLTEGVPVSFQKEGDERGARVWFVDFENPENNEFVVTNQFKVIENGCCESFDIVLFVNGIPLVVIDLAKLGASLDSTYKQIQVYKSTISSLFTYNGFVVISDALVAKAGTISAAYSRYMVWRSLDGKVEVSQQVTQLEILIQGMLNKQTLTNLIRHFIVFEKTKIKDNQTGIVTILIEKKLAAYHQYYAVNKAVESVTKASGYGSVKGDSKGGVIWHTQGSGKSLSMVFFAGKIVLSLDNPTLLILTDRNDLDDQLFDTFAASKQLLRQEPIQAESKTELKRLLKVASGGIVFTTIQKFEPEEEDVFEELSARRNIIIIADEAYRAQYGFKTNNKYTNGSSTGKKQLYGFAKYMRDAFPNATCLGFTGIPIENTDVFGNCLDVYDIAKSVEDGITVRIYHEDRLDKVKLGEKGKILAEDMDDDFDQSDLSDNQSARVKWNQLESLMGNKKRIQRLAQDIVSHFEQRQQVYEGKGLIVAMSRRIAIQLYNAIVFIRPDWHSDDLDKGVIKVVTSSSASDVARVGKHYLSKKQRRVLAERMKSPTDELKLVIVRDMWLTGFDAPCMHTLYVDKPMKGHNLMQAIARVNRVYKDKPGGLVIDYLGVTANLNNSLAFYAESGGRGVPTQQQQVAVDLLLEKLNVVSDMYKGFVYDTYFDGNLSQKKAVILDAEEHLLGIKDGKNRYINEVTELSRAFVLAIPHERALSLKYKIAFFQAVKARLVKFSINDMEKITEDIDSTVKDVIDKSFVLDPAFDVFAAAGLNKPKISILSLRFFGILKKMKHKNVAIELFCKLLSDEIKVRASRNLVESRVLMDILEDLMEQYHDRRLIAKDIIEELINMSKHIVELDRLPSMMGLSASEYAFYTAIASNKDVQKLMKKDKLRDLAVILAETVKQNAAIDWVIKENVRAKLKVAVKRVLRVYGYPSDMQVLATETILKQAELIMGED